MAFMRIGARHAGEPCSRPQDLELATARNPGPSSAFPRQRAAELLAKAAASEPAWRCHYIQQAARWHKLATLMETGGAMALRARPGS